jgi:hypothetical protein
LEKEIVLRDQINSRHPVFGDSCRKVKDREKLESTDETACVSCLLSLEGDVWSKLDANDPWIGKTVGEVLGPNSDDADASERVFRRKK